MPMMPARKSSIKSKVMKVIMLASVSVLLVTVAAFMVYDWVTFRQTMQRNLETQARLIAENSWAAMAFGNETDAANLLATLRTDPHIIAAAFYGPQGNLFVKYPAHIAAAELPDKPPGWNHEFGNSRMIVFQPIIHAGGRLGTLYLQSDVTAISQRLQLYGAISLLIMLGSLVVAYWLSNTLQRRISDPIIRLAETARKISEAHNYSLRATKLSDDELGLLTDAFNEMLERIQTSDAALRASERRERERAEELGVVIGAIPTPVIIVHDRDAQHMSGNQAADNLVRIPVGGELSISAPDNLKPRHFKSFKNGRELRLEELPAQRAARGELVRDFEFDLVFEDGTIRNLLGYGTPLLDAEGRPRGAVHTLVDITERKHAEEILRQAKESAESANRSKDDFLAALSHELRTPLNPVLLVASEAANNAELSAETRAHFDMIRRNVELEARLIDDLLDLTRITRGKLSLEKSPLDVRAVLQDTIAIVQADVDKKQIALIFDAGPKAHIISGDAVRLQQIFWNVLKNAVKFTPVGGKVTIEICSQPESGNIVVKITDTGIGLTSGEIVHIFDAFSQGDHAVKSGARRFGGLGLGLTISRMLVELHSGAIYAASLGRDQGATFMIEFPSAKANTNNDSFAPEQHLLPDTSQTVFTPKKVRCILLVEDHEPTRIALTHLLTRRNYKVMSATSVTEAIARAQREKFDLVVSDIGLPDGNGYDLMSKLRDEFGLKGIALSGYGSEQDLEQGKRAGFVAHLIKPVRVESLEKVLREVG